jgi:hypothetical protein
MKKDKTADLELIVKRLRTLLKVTFLRLIQKVLTYLLIRLSIKVYKSNIR